MFDPDSNYGGWNKHGKSFIKETKEISLQSKMLYFINPKIPMINIGMNSLIRTSLDQFDSFTLCLLKIIDKHQDILNNGERE